MNVGSLGCVYDGGARGEEVEAMEGTGGGKGRSGAEVGLAESMWRAWRGP